MAKIHVTLEKHEILIEVAAQFIAGMLTDIEKIVRFAGELAAIDGKMQVWPKREEEGTK